MVRITDFSDNRKKYNLVIKSIIYTFGHLLCIMSSIAITNFFVLNLLLFSSLPSFSSFLEAELC